MARLTDSVHEAVGECLHPGETAIDATVGNGHDTLWLARRVGHLGRVYGFDLQESALRATAARLEEEGMAGQVTLLPLGHERMADALPAGLAGRVRAVLFNLGYLPGSDKRCITRPETTLTALDQALSLLAPGGLLSVLAYTGHDGGREEADAVIGWLETLDEDRFRVEVVRNEQARGPSPELSLVWRREHG